MVAEDDDGPLRLRVLGRDEADAQLLAKFWRFLFYKDGGPTFHLTRLEDVEHEAYTLLLADRAQVPVPPVVVAGTAGPGTALLVVRPAGGSPTRRHRTVARHRRRAHATSGAQCSGCTPRASRTAC